MCTSYASKPARSNAAAISMWPLTPCSRSTAIFGRAPAAMQGAAGSSRGSNVNTGARPGSLSSFIRSNSCSAASGLSRSRCSACVVADHARCKSMRASSSRIVRSRVMRTRASRVGSPTQTQRRPAASNAATTRLRSPVAICRTAPSSSLKSASRGVPGTSSMSIASPHRLANAISSNVVRSPPSERSW